jgi:hypothetical protein
MSERDFNQWNTRRHRGFRVERDESKYVPAGTYAVTMRYPVWGGEGRTYARFDSTSRFWRDNVAYALRRARLTRAEEQHR